MYARNICSVPIIYRILHQAVELDTSRAGIGPDLRILAKETDKLMVLRVIRKVQDPMGLHNQSTYKLKETEISERRSIKM